MIKLNPEARTALQTLLDGNERFRSGQSEHRTYTIEDIQEHSKGQSPVAAVIACSDSRLTPEILFDQPLGTIFSSRNPGNVAGESARWMSELAAEGLKLPLLLVLGHTGCLAVAQVMNGSVSGANDRVRAQIDSAYAHAKASAPEDLYLETVKENVRETIKRLRDESWALRKAVESGTTSVVGAVYDLETGEINLLEPDLLEDEE